MGLLGEFGVRLVRGLRPLATPCEFVWFFLVVLPLILVFVEFPTSVRRWWRDRKPENELALARAIEAHNARHSAPARNSRILCALRERCYVIVAHPTSFVGADGEVRYHPIDSEQCSLYAVWYSDGRVVEVVTKSFAFGLGPIPVADKFEAAQNQHATERE